MRGSFHLSAFLFITLSVQILAKDYTSEYIYKVRIGPEAEEIKMLLNTKSTKNSLFSNSNRQYAKEIQTKRQSNILMDKIEMGGQIIPEFPFTLLIDPTGLNNRKLQGEFGLGIGESNSNDLIDTLNTNQAMKSKKLILEPTEDISNNEINFNADGELGEFNFCNLTVRNDLDEEYHNAWVCRMTHYLLVENEDELIWNNTEEINDRVVFDTTQKYIHIPIDYMDHLSKVWRLKSNGCGITDDEVTGLKYYVCPKTFNKVLENLVPIYLIIGDGIAYGLTAKELFEDFKGTQNISSLIRFTDENNVWTLGTSFLKKHRIMLNWDEQTVGVSGGDVIDFTKDYQGYIGRIQDEIASLFGVNNLEKILLYAGAGIGSLILLIALFILIRDCKRANPKNHISFVEEK